MSHISFSSSPPRSIPISRIRVLHPLARGIAGDPLSEFYYAELIDEQAVQVVYVQQLRRGSELEGADRLVKRMAHILSIWPHLDHPNIVPLIGFYMSKDDPKGWLISPVMERGFLHDYIRDKELDMEVRLQLCCDTSLGVSYLHSLSPPICHGNLTSGSIVVNGHGRAMISNLVFAEPSTSDHVERISGVDIERVEGNIRWMSPESIVEELSPTEKGDVWSFACVCYEILTSEIPYSQYRFQDNALILNIMQGRLPGEFDSVSLPGKVAYLFSGCWSIHPEERPTMATVAATLLNTPDERYIHTSGRMQNRVVITRGARANIERGLFVFGDGLTQIVAVKTYQENLVRVVNAQAPKCWDVLSDEASEWRLLKHDNLVPVWGFLHEPSPALIYPWYDNGDLGSYLLSNPHLEISEKLTLLRQVAHGLAYLHQQVPAIIHRHLNINHVLLNSSGDAAILGCHLPLENAVSGEDETAPFLFPEPHAPEIVMNESPTTATDVFGFGVLMLQVLTGKSLHYDASTHTRTVRILEGRMLDRTLYPGLPDTHLLWSVIQSCLAVDGLERPTISEVANKLYSEVDQDENRSENAEESPLLLEPAEPIEGSDQASTPGSELAGGEVPGDLVLDQNAPVSAGGFADVYKGTLTAFNGESLTVAVKILRVKRSPDDFDLKLNFKDAVRLVKREALIWRRVKHDFIAPFLGFQIKDNPCLVSLWYENGNLDTFLRSHPDFQAEEKLRLIYETALALNYLHHSSPPICHADIKPTNVLISDSIHAQLTDFGLSELLHGSEGGILTHIQPTGTKGFQAPELLFGTSPSIESDIFAFGSFIIATMSGLPPFHNLTAAQTVFAFTRNVLPSPQDHPGLSPKLWQLVKECFRLEPLERPDISQVVSVLSDEISEGSSGFLIDLIESSPPR